MSMHGDARLTRFAQLSAAAALVTIALKTGAWLSMFAPAPQLPAWGAMTQVLVAFGISECWLGWRKMLAIAMLTVAARPADDEHPYGHDKAEYFSSGAEGALILIAAVGIGFAALRRLFAPRPLESLGVGIAISLAASVVNLIVALVIRRAGRRHGSVTLEANAGHLLTDVWTSIGVLAGVGAAAVTHLYWLDPLVGLLVSVGIIRTGLGIVRRSVTGLMDTALTPADQDTLRRVLERHIVDPIQVHALRSRQSGTRRFVSLHVLVPGDWSVQRGHELLEQIESDIGHALPGASVLTHLESLDDPASWDDIALDRGRPPSVAS